MEALNDLNPSQLMTADSFREEPTFRDSGGFARLIAAMNCEEQWLAGKVLFSNATKVV